jgi:hypothetical protein
MLLAVDTTVMFRPFTLEGASIVQCSSCAALVPAREKLKHRRFHDDVRAVTSVNSCFMLASSAPSLLVCSSRRSLSRMLGSFACCDTCHLPRQSAP